MRWDEVMDDPRQAARRLGWQSLALLALVVGYHFALRWLMLHRGLVLGAVGPGTKVYRAVPLYAYFRPHLKTGLPIAAAVLVGFWYWLRTRAWNPQRLRHAVVPALALWYVALASAIAMIDGGPKRLWRPYELLADTDYIGAVAQVESARSFLGEYVSRMPELPMHCQVHPPGGVLVLWWVDQYFFPGPAAAAVATILAAALAVPAVYGLAQEVLDERFARLATCLFLVAPNVLLYTATSMDAVFMVPMVWTVYLLWRARDRRPWLLGAAGGLAAAVAGMMTFSAAFLALWALASLLVTALADRAKLRATVLSLSAAAASCSLAYLLLYGWSGYLLLDNLAAAWGGHHQIMSGGNYATPRQYGHLVVGNLVAFFAATGIPLAVLFAGQTWRDLRGREGPSSGRSLNLSYLLALAALVAAPLYTLEVERIWLFMVPLIAIPAARRLSPSADADRPGPTVALTFLLLAVQVVVMETLLNTTW